jgi:hypothetical protein
VAKSKQSYAGIVDENVLHSSIRKRLQPQEQVPPKPRKTAVKKTTPPVKKKREAANAKTAEPRPWERRDARTREETKSRRLQIVMRPSLYEQLKAYADRGGYSVNEVITGVVENFIKTV